MSNDTNNINQIMTTFPWVMVLTSLIFNGFVFLLINGPLVVELLIGNGHISSQDVIATGIFMKWVNLYKTNPGASFFAIYLISALVAGLVVHVASQFFSWILGTILNRLIKVKVIAEILRTIGIRLDSPNPFFTVTEFNSPDHSDLAVWLLKNKPEKWLWEWDLFFHNIYWGLTTNMLLLSFLTWRLAKSIDCWLIVLAFISLVLVI